jgi:hypothetical protein
MPVFVRGGGILLSRTDQADNLAQHPVGPLTVDVATGGTGQFDLYEDAGDGTAYQQGQSATTHLTSADGALDIAAQQGSYPGQVTSRAWTARVHNAGTPSQVTVNGTTLSQTGTGPGWSYDPATRTLTIRTSTLPTNAPVQIRYNGGRIGPIASGLSSALCVDDADASADNGTAIQLYGCNGTAAQQWTVASDGTLQVFGKCMDVTDGATGNGTPVQLYDCNGTGAQQWQPQPDGSLRNPASGRCLDDPSFSTADGTQLEIWDCNGGTNQRWTLPD